MQSRMKSPAVIIPQAMQAIQALNAAIQKSDLPAKLLALVHLRASQINGCSFCVDAGVRHARKEGESDERIGAVAAWRHAPYFDDAERAALALTEAVTRLSDREDPVPDAVWNEAARCFSERGLAGLLLCIALTNVYNRLNVSTRQIAGKWEPGQGIGRRPAPDVTG